MIDGRKSFAGCAADPLAIDEQFCGADFDIGFDRGRCRCHEVSLLILVRALGGSEPTLLIAPLDANLVLRGNRTPAGRVGQGNGGGEEPSLFSTHLCRVGAQQCCSPTWKAPVPVERRGWRRGGLRRRLGLGWRGGGGRLGNRGRRGNGFECSGRWRWLRLG